jgi:predicted small metal-binding protein
MKGVAMKELRCRDAGFDCDAVIHAQSEEEVLKIAAQHAKEVHKVDVTPAMAKQIATLIHDEK